MRDDLLAWNWRISSSSRDFFWFGIVDGVFGYYMSHAPDDFNPWELEVAMRQAHEWVKDSPRVETFGPFTSEIPPVIAKIRQVEQRHKRYVERKANYA